MKKSIDTSVKNRATGSGRRNFFVRIWQLLTAIACLEIFWIGGSLLKSRKSNRAQADGAVKIVEAGNIDQFEPGEVKAFPQGGFYLSCLEDGSFMALSKTCTHLGCSVPWNQEQQKFICPCHGSSFDLKGVVLTPPAIRPLDYYPVRIENGRIRVDIAHLQRRDIFELSQATHS